MIIIIIITTTTPHWVKAWEIMWLVSNANMKETNVFVHERSLEPCTITGYFHICLFSCSEMRQMFGCPCPLISSWGPPFVSLLDLAHFGLPQSGGGWGRWMGHLQEGWKNISKGEKEVICVSKGLQLWFPWAEKKYTWAHGLWELLRKGESVACLSHRWRGGKILLPCENFLSNTKQLVSQWWHRWHCRLGRVGEKCQVLF